MLFSANTIYITTPISFSYNFPALKFYMTMISFIDQPNLKFELETFSSVHYQCLLYKEYNHMSVEMPDAGIKSALVKL